MYMDMRVHDIQWTYLCWVQSMRWELCASEATALAYGARRGPPQHMHPATMLRWLSMVGEIAAIMRSINTRHVVIFIISSPLVEARALPPRR